MLARTVEAQKEGRDMSTTTNSKATHPHATAGEILTNGALAVGDFGIVPGASLLVEGNVKAGALHVVGGLVARALFGPIGWIAVGANAYSRSITGKNLYEHFFEVEKAKS